MSDDDYYTVLQQESAADEGSFLCQLHYFTWDKAAFTRVTNAMFACCQAYDEGTQPPTTLFGQAYEPRCLPRWLTEVFWEVATVLAGPTRNPAWKELIAADPEYYDRARDRLRDLAYWFFSGRCGYENPAKHFAPM